MSDQDDQTRFGNIDRMPARFVLALFFIFTVISLYTSLSSHRIAFYDREATPSDLELYWAEVDRIADGQGYYEAASIELPARGYPTQSVFNWRMPLPMWFLGKLPRPEYGKWLLSAFAVTLLVSGSIIAIQEGTFLEATALGVLLGGAILPCVLSDLYVSPLLWSSVFLSLSICAYSWNQRWLVLLLGLAAVVFREFALLYCVLMAVIAGRNRHLRELVGWIVVIAIFAGFLVFHILQVKHYQDVPDVADTSHWLELNGLPAIIGMTQMNGFLLLLPQWVSAIYLASSILGFVDWRSSLGNRMSLTVGAFLLVFMIVGKDVNQYWGVMFAPLLCFGAARAPMALRRLIRAAK